MNTSRTKTIDATDIKANGIAGKIVVITGASSGLGEAAARHLAALGARVVLAARRAERIEQLAAEIAERGGEALPVRADVTRAADMRQVMDAAVAKHGRVDVLVNNAGIAPLSMLDSGNTEEWNRMIDVNVKGVLNGIAAALPLMQRQRAGHIVNVSSIAAFSIGPGTAVYSATKQAVRAISEGLRQEALAHGIRTTIVSPGAVTSELPEGVSDPVIAQAIRGAYEIALPAESFARAVAFAIGQPEEMGVNEIVFRPVRQAA
ncbi:MULTISPECIES: SDR family oxidoreductase [unclassified Burkholderia]|uniref:SDR family oxidoreductase n=1 Tax=unclassified Burkholderia TaxID=2613784 RepID=UPI00141D83E0|nr:MULTISPECIES: SDR family oxidoreductase [unclassified Burkholderia]NIE81981.1 SDR family oxidoreductase [Burkholderia sp. Tr-860]NIF61211.1 SDR family oxidoreductase [Burkholderia sp. Cy-647]NIF94136.1 SDR family oxidoreductase [Burkholderia sp. Ax-1720]